MGTLFRQNDPLKMGTGLAASSAHPRRNQIWVPPPPPGGEYCTSQRMQYIWYTTNYTQRCRRASHGVWSG